MDAYYLNIPPDHFATEHESFTRSLRNIKSREIQDVAARFCRAIRELPPNYEERIIKNGGNTVDQRGYHYDSLWDENVGATLACRTGVTRQLAVTAIEFLYDMSTFCVKYRDALALNAINEPGCNCSQDIGILKARFDAQLLDDVVVSNAKNTLTYSQLGFYLNQRTINVDDRHADHNTIADVFDFAKALARTDIIAELKIVHGLIDAGNFATEAPGASSAVIGVLTGMFNKIHTIILAVFDMVMDMGHLIDGIAACNTTNAVDDAINDPTSFDPAIDPNYRKVAVTAAANTDSIVGPLQVGAKYTYAIMIGDAGTNYRRIVVQTKFPYRLEGVTYNKFDIEFGVINTSGSGVGSKAVYTTRDINMSKDIVTELIISKISPDGSTPNATSVTLYVNKKKDL